MDGDLQGEKGKRPESAGTGAAVPFVLSVKEEKIKGKKRGERSRTAEAPV